MATDPNLRASVNGWATVPAVEVKSKNGPARATASTLTAAENRVLALVTLAKTNKEIARALGISPSTVKRHLENLLRKLQLKNRVAAAIYGMSINRCAHGLDAGCALWVWHKEREVGESTSTWAD